jgi:hypothetical protein
VNRTSPRVVRRPFLVGSQVVVFGRQGRMCQFISEIERNISEGSLALQNFEGKGKCKEAWRARLGEGDMRTNTGVAVVMS